MSNQAANPTVALNQRLGSLDQQMSTIAERMEQLSLDNDQGENHAEVRQEISTLQNEVRTIASSIQLLTQDRKIKVGEPEYYYGDPEKLQDWLTSMLDHFEFKGIASKPGKDKVRVAGTYLRGDARKWYEPLLRDYLSLNLEDQEDRVRQVFASFGGFEKAIKKAFGDINEKYSAEREMRHLVQKTSVRKYSSRFLQLASHTDWSEDALMATLRDGLKEEVKNGLIYFTEEPKDIDELIERAQMIDRRLWESRLDRKERIFPDRRNKNRTQNFARREPDGDVIMTGAQVNLSEARKKGLCFECGRKGHQARSCRSKKNIRGKEPETKRLEARMVLYDNDGWNSEEKDSAEIWDVYEDPEPDYAKPIASQDQAELGSVPHAESSSQESDYECPSGIEEFFDAHDENKPDQELPSTESEDEAIEGAHKLLAEIEGQQSYPEVEERSEEIKANLQKILSWRERRRGERRRRAQSSVEQQHDGSLKGQEVHISQKDSIPTIRTGGREPLRYQEISTLVAEQEHVADNPTESTSSRSEITTHLSRILWRNVRTSAVPAWKEYCKVRKAHQPAERNHWIMEENLRNQRCSCFDFDFRCWGYSGETWTDHTVNLVAKTIACQYCFSWMKRYCPVPSHHWKNKRNILQDISTRKATVLEERFAKRDGQLCCDLNWCLHEFSRHREVEIPWWACFNPCCKEHLPMKQRNRFYPFTPTVTLLNGQQCPCLRIGCLCGCDPRHPFHLEMSTPQLCLSNSCKDHEMWKKGLRIHCDSSRTSDPEITRGIDDLTRKFANWKIDQICDSKESTIRIDIEIRGQKVLAEIDCGATGNFVNLAWAMRQGMSITEKGTALVTLFDGSQKEVPKRTTVIPFKIGTAIHTQTFNVLEETGTNKVVLGMPWLKRYNPTINWKDRKVKIGKVCMQESSVCDASIERRIGEGSIASQKTARRYQEDLETSTSEKVENPDYQERLAEAKERIPNVYHEFLGVFAKQE